MAAKRGLRVATEDDQPKKVLSLAEAVEAGDYREILLAQRREIAKSLPDERGPAKAALHRQLSIISKEIEALDAANLDGEDSVTAQTADEAWNGTSY